MAVIGCGSSRTPKLVSVSPSILCAGSDNDLTLMGSGLSAKTVQIGVAPDMGMPTMTVTASSLKGSGASVVAHFPANSLTPAPMKLDVIYTDTNGKELVLPGAVTVVANPIVFYADPPYVYGKITTPVTVYTTGYLGPMPSKNAVVLTPHGGGTPIDLTGASTIDAKHPKHILVEVPPGIAAGPYDLTLTDMDGCTGTYANAITVVTMTTTLKDITPPFGYDQSTTDVQVDASAAFFQPGARAYLTKHGSTMSPAVPLSAPVTQSPTKLTAIVPSLGALCTGASPAQAVTCNDGLWDVVVVNPDGTIGFFDSGGAGAFTVEPLPVPVISSVSPGGVVTNCAGAACQVTISGQNFATMSGSTPPPVTLDCVVLGMTTHTTVTPTLVSADDKTVVVTLPAATMTANTVCVPTVNNATGGNTMFATGGTVAVFSPAFNIDTINDGQPLVTARRAPALVLNGPTQAARYLYAIGGDDGTLDGTSKLPTSGIKTVELALQDPFSGEKAWATLPAQSNLPASITLAGAANAGHFIYLVGGYDTKAAASLDTVYRAEVLQPSDAPQIDDADLTPDPSDGLASGLYFYRVAAVLKSTDAINGGGETLAGDEFAINVPTFPAGKVQVTISWTGGPANVDHWRIYRTSMAGMMPGSEDVVFATADASSTTFIDQGATKTPFAAGTPQPFGALGVWMAQATLNAHRAGAGVTALVDPSASSKAYLYAGFGYDSTVSGVLASYEVLTIDTGTGAPSGGWSAPAAVSNGGSADVGRWLGGAYAITPDVDSLACPTSGACQAYVAFGPGAASAAADGAAANAVGNTDIGVVTPGSGTLPFGTAGPNNHVYGYGAVAASNTMFQIGGSDAGGSTEKLNSLAITAKATNASSTPTLNSSYGPQGSGVLNVGGTASPRFLPGATFSSPFFYTVGGSATVGGAAKADTFYDLF